MCVQGNIKVSSCNCYCSGEVSLCL